MSSYEVALLVATALFVCILLWDNHRLRGRLERSEADIAWLKRAMHNTIEVHQKTMEQHTAGIKRLDEQTGKISSRAEQFRQSQPDFVKLRADMDRLLKADYYKRTSSQAAMQKLLQDGQEELRKERPV